MKSDKDLFSVASEVANQETLQKQASREEKKSQDEQELLSSYYSSVEFEPGNTGDPIEKFKMRSEQLEASNECDSLGQKVLSALGNSILFGMVGGLLAIPTCFMVSQNSVFKVLSFTVLGPFLEETVKQFGMFYMMERRPSKLKFWWQFYVSAFCGGLVFSVIENLIYRYVYLANLPTDDLATIMAWRWTICIMGHIFWPMISGTGLLRVWLECRKLGIPNRIERAYPWFIAAMILHGAYNFLMTFNQLK